MMAQITRPRGHRPRPHLWLLAGLASLALVAATIAGAIAQPASDPEWPCVQRLVPELAAAAIWQGPPLPEPAGTWQDQSDIAAVVPRLLDRHLPDDRLAGEIGQFIGSSPPDMRAERIAFVLDGVLDTSNAERQQMILGIKRFARRQRALADRINDETRKLRDLDAQGTLPAVAEATELRQGQLWDMRVFDERQRTLTLACEQPVRVDQRVFAVARLMAEQLR